MSRADVNDAGAFAPVRVVWLSGPQRAASGTPPSAHTFCFVGSDGIPRYIRDAVARVAAAIAASGPDSEQTRDACDSARLRDYYGADDVRDMLGIDLAMNVHSIIQQCAGAPAWAQFLQVTQPDYQRPREGSAVARVTDDEELIAIERMLDEEDATRDEQSARAHRDRSARAQIDIPPQFAPGGITFVPDVQMFPEDSFMDVKRKIFVQTRIPIYRQHLVAIHSEPDPRSTISYTISTAGPHIADFRDLYCARPEGSRALELFDIPIDRAIYDARDDLRVEARDHITTIADATSARDRDFFIVLDIANWIVPRIEHIRAALGDDYQFELLYYGFIVKYFPMLTRECFGTYIANEGEMVDRFPDLAPPWSSIRAAVLSQCEISADARAHAARSHRDLDHAITSAHVTARNLAIPQGARVVNLHDFFESIVCSATLIDVRAILDTAATGRDRRGAQRLYGHKIFKHSELMSAQRVASGRVITIKPSDYGAAPAAARWTGHIPSLGTEPGVLITYLPRATPISPLFIIIRASGSVSYHSQWREEDDIDYARMVDHFAQHSARAIAELAGSAFARVLTPITEDNLNVRALSISVRYRRTITPKAFRELCDMWHPYMRAGIAMPRQTTKDTFSFTFARGMSAIDMTQLDYRLSAAGIADSNHYAYLSVSAMRQKWAQNFAGRVVRITHRATDVCFDVRDIYDSELDIFEQYLGAFISNFERDHIRGAPDDAGALDASRHGERRRLRRLQEIDPVLYNLKKHGAPHVYSVRCQRGKQPLLYSDREIAARKGNPDRARGLTRYWNFTTRRPAYYACPDAAYPHLNFIVDAHPKGYCIPCCGKMKPGAGSKHAAIERVCLEKHEYNIAHITESPIGYVMSFGKDLPEGRLSHLPAGYLRDTLNRAVSARHPGAQLLIFGVPPGHSIIHTIRAALGLSIAQFIGEIARALEKGIIGFDTIAGGRAATYFSSRRAFAGYIASLATDRAQVFPEGTAEFMRAVITDCARAAFGIEMIYLLTAPARASDNPAPPDAPTQLRDMRIILSRASSPRGARHGFAVIDGDGVANPVLAIHPEDFARDGSVAERELIPECVAIIDQIVLGFEARRAKQPNLMLMREFCRATGAYAIRKLYIGLRGLCYAVLLEQRARKKSAAPPRAYVPIVYSPAQKQPDEDTAPDSLDDRDITAHANERAITAINNYIIGARLPYAKLNIGARVRVGDSEIAFIVVAGVKMLSYFDVRDASASVSDGNTPRVSASDGNTPRVSASDGNTPRVSASDGNTPRVSVSDGNTPRVSASDGNTPRVSVSDGNTPRVSVSDGDTSRAITLTVDPRVHARSLATRTFAPDGDSADVVARIGEEAARQLYPYWEYELFCVQFMAHVATLRNTRARGQIIDAVSARTPASARRDALRAMDPPLTKHDLAIASGLIRAKHSSAAARALESATLDADRAELQSRIVTPDSADAQSLAQWIEQIMEPFVARDDEAEPISRVPAIIAPCAPTPTAAPHCNAAGRLIIRSRLETLAQILAADLRNPLKYAYITARGYAPESRSPFADFTRRASEVLIVRKSEIQP